MPQKRKASSGRKVTPQPRRKAGSRSQDVRVQRGRDGVQVIMVDKTDRVPHLPSATPHVSRSKSTRTGKNAHPAGELIPMAINYSWKYRWQLTPFAAWLIMFIIIKSSMPLAVCGLIALGGLGYATAQTERGIGKRKLLSQRERMLVCYWAAGALASALIEALSDPWIWQRATFTLTGATAYQSFLWLRSRRPTATPAGKMTKESAERLKLWARVGKYSDGVLKGSTLVSGTATEPMMGTIVFTAQLRADQHGKHAETELVWRKVEALLGLPPDTVRIKCDKTNATRIEVTMAVSKHLETNEVPWPGPELTSKGNIVLGETPSGKTVDVIRYNDKGVLHGRLNGNTGNGKTSTARVLLTARASAMTSTHCSSIPSGILLDVETFDAKGNPVAHDWSISSLVPEEVIWCLDGKRGTSMPEIANIFDWYAVTDDEWPLVLDTLNDIMLDRQLRRGKQKKSSWRPGAEEDPIITCYLAEASSIRDSLLARGQVRHYDRVVLALLRQGRALGIVMIQESQDATAPNWLGGRDARELMGKGAAIMHRPGGATGAQFSGDGAAAKVNLLKLPPAEGFAAVVANGAVLADVMRVRWCSEEASAAWAENYYARQLEGRDLAVAGEAYLKRTRGRADEEAEEQVLQEAVGDTGNEPAPRIERPALTVVPDVAAEIVDERTEEEVTATTREWLIKVVSFSKSGLTTAEIIERGGGKRGRGQTNIYDQLKRLKEAGVLTQREDGRWTKT